MNSSKKMDSGSKDLLSNLPDALVCHILSFLSTKDAALTSVLSKRWRKLLAFVPNLDLDDSIYDHPDMGLLRRHLMRKSFKLFVYRVMTRQGNASLNKFSLFGRDPSHVNGWVLFALERGVVDLDLYIYSSFSYCSLPSKVLVSKTLVRLKVGGKNEFIIDVKEDVFLPKLKTLYLGEHVWFSDESGAAFAKLISGCHALEELIMVDLICYRWDSFSVSNPTLKRLTIRFASDIMYPKSVSFDTPNLIYLDFTDTVAVKYPKANFDSLVEASIGLQMPFDAMDAVGDAAGFLMGISNVKILYLSSKTLKVLAFCCKAMPVFKNLIQLTIQTEQDVGWESLPNLLENCPNLETLVFDGFHYRDTNQCLDESHRFRDTNKCHKDNDRCECKPWAGTPIWLSSSPVKVLKVLKFGEISHEKDDMVKQIDLIEYLLETMPNLEQVILYYDTLIDGDLKIVSADFQMLEKVASPKCKIQVISDSISFSTTVGSSLSTSKLAMFYRREG